MNKKLKRATRSRRSVLGLLSTLPLTGTVTRLWARTGDHRSEQRKETMTGAEEQETRKVELLYSTKPIRVLMGSREYSVPANYLGPKGRDEPDILDAGKTGFAFAMFLPDFVGYTKDNWRDRFDHGRIDVLWVRQVDRNVMVPRPDGSSERITPAGYGDPKARFVNLSLILQAQPSFKLYGLDGYRRQGRGTRTVTWTGYRSNGEFFFFDSSYGPQDPVPRGNHPLCTTQYYSAAEDLSIAYRYSQDHIARWREIDDAIWAKVRSWQVK